MRRRRFKRRLQWFPPLGASANIGDDVERFSFDTFEVGVLANGGINSVELPLTFDFGTEELQTFASENVPNLTLSDLQGSSWRLRRAVGKIHAAFFPGRVEDNTLIGLNTAVPACKLGIGLMVRKVQGQASNTSGNVGVLDRDDATDPWIWRRTWLLGQDATVCKNAFFPGILTSLDPVILAPIGGVVTKEQYAFSMFPQTNARYGSVMDGPHVDAKTNRIIGPDERLFLHFATKALPIQPQPTYQDNSSVIGTFDLRLLGHIMRTTNRRHASR